MTLLVYAENIQNKYNLKKIFFVLDKNTVRNFLNAVSMQRRDVGQIWIAVIFVWTQDIFQDQEG